MRHTHGHIIEKLLIFRQPEQAISTFYPHGSKNAQRDWNFIWRALPLFQSISFAQYEILYREGDIANECYFILDGCVVFSTRTGKPYRKILPGMHFGQISILKDQSRTQNAIAASMCDLLTLSKSDFLQLLAEFPQIAREIKQEANEKRDFLRIEKDEVKRSNARPVFRNILASRTLWQLNESPSDNESAVESVHSNQQPTVRQFSELDLRRNSISYTEFPNIKESHSEVNAPRQISILTQNNNRRDSFEVDEQTVDRLLEMKGSNNSLVILSNILGESSTSPQRNRKQMNLLAKSSHLETTQPSSTEEEDICFFKSIRNSKKDRRKSLFKPACSEVNYLQDLSDVLKSDSVSKMANLLDDMVEVLKLSNQQQASIAEELGGIRQELALLRAQKATK